MARHISTYVLLSLALVGVSCSSQAEGPTPFQPALSTAVTVTTKPPEDTELPTSPTRGLLKLQPGVTYTASGFWKPFSLSVVEEGWWWRGSDDLWAYLEYHEPNESLFYLDVALLAHGTDSAPESIATGFGDRQSILVLRGPDETTIGDHAASVVDVFNTDEVDESLVGFSCDTVGAGYSRYWRNEPGSKMLSIPAPADTEGQVHFGLAACRAARIWAVDADGDTITIVAATFSQELFDGLIATAERLLAGIAFST